jgi:hypothetical protein
MLRLLLVEDRILFGDALALTLNRQPNLEVAGQCGSLWLRMTYHREEAKGQSRG